MTALCLALITLLAVWDAREYVLPDSLTLTLIATGLVSAFVNGRLGWSLTGMLAAGGILLIACLAGGTGGGDFKMAAGLGAWFGWYGAFLIIAAGGILGVIFGIIKILRSRKPFREAFFAKSLDKNSPNTVPLGLFWGIAAWGYVLLTVL